MGFRFNPGRTDKITIARRAARTFRGLHTQVVARLQEMLKMSNSSATTENDLIDPIHPGETLMEDFINGFGITQNKLAVSIGVPPRRIHEIVLGRRAITADAALRLGCYFGLDLQFWLNLQSRYELELAEDRVAEQNVAITPLQVA